MEKSLWMISVNKPITVCSDLTIPANGPFPLWLPLIFLPPSSGSLCSKCAEVLNSNFSFEMIDIIQVVRDYVVQQMTEEFPFRKYVTQRFCLNIYLTSIPILNHTVFIARCCDQHVWFRSISEKLILVQALMMSMLTELCEYRSF